MKLTVAFGARSLSAALGRTTRNVSVIKDAQNRADVPREERE
jgi:hypothetical protein